MKKKILFTLSSMNIGGVEKSLLSLLSIIPNNKYDVTVLLLENKGGFLEYLPDWVRVEEAAWYREVKPIIMQPPQQTIKSYINHKQYFKALIFLFSYLISKYTNNRFFYYKQVMKGIPKNLQTYDVAITYQGPTDILDFYLVNKVYARRKISWLHFDISQHQINKELYKKLYKKIDKVFVVSNGAKLRLLEKIPSVKGKEEVLLNIISNKLINDMSKEIIDFDSSYKGLRIVTVGRLSKEKGQDIAIRVLSKLRKNGYEVRWYCIGEGSARKEYEELIDKYDLSNNFRLYGSTANPYPYIAGADVYVQTSRHEGYCLTLAEAKCLHKPIVTTNFTGSYEQIEDGINGYIASYNEEDLYKKIKHLIDNPNERERLRKNLLMENVDTSKEAQKLVDYVG